jgi:hypothetical protein
MVNSKHLISDAEDEEWPVVISICNMRRDLFVDHKYAHLSDTESWILWHSIKMSVLGVNERP